MKAVKIKIEDGYQVICPKCGKELRPLVMDATCHMPSNGDGVYNQPFINSEFQYHTMGERDKNFTKGSLFFCQECEEVMFAYTTEDTRICRDCPHCEYKSGLHGGFGSSYYCKWFNCNMSNNINGVERAHCEHIDETLPEGVPSYAICALCAYARVDLWKTGEFSCRYYRRRNAGDVIKDIYNVKESCYEFELDFKHYADYREYFDRKDDLWDTSIHIPGYDKILKELPNTQQYMFHLSWADGAATVDIAAFTDVFDPKKYLFVVLHNQEVILSHTEPKKNYPGKEPLEILETMINTPGVTNFRDAIISAIIHHHRMKFDRSILNCQESCQAIPDVLLCSVKCLRDPKVIPFDNN